MWSHQARHDIPLKRWRDRCWVFDIILNALLCGNIGIDELADAVCSVAIKKPLSCCCVVVLVNSDWSLGALSRIFASVRSYVICLQPMKVAFAQEEAGKVTAGVNQNNEFLNFFIVLLRNSIAYSLQQ